MIMNGTGLVRDTLYVCGLSTYPVELLDGMTPALFDGGVACAGLIYADAVQDILGGRQPGIIFISHAHWDHCGAVAYLKSRFPSMKIAMSPVAEAILKRRGAVSQIKKLNDEARSVIAGLPEADLTRLVESTFQPFETDIKLQDGQTIDIGRGLTVEVLATPGHTRDHMSYYIPEKKILIAPEACGCLDATGAVIVQFLADYELYLSSLERLAELPADILCQGHRLVFVGREEVRGFFDRSLKATAYFKNRVYRLLEAEKRSLENVVMQIKAVQYDTNRGIKQPEIPYLINLRAQVRHLADKAGWSPASQNP